MRTLKILAMISLLFAAVSMAACSGTDLSGTAGEQAEEPAQPEEPGKGGEEPEQPEQPEEPEEPEEPSKEEPSKEEPGANEPGSGNTEPEEPAKGGEDEPAAGGGSETLDEFLNKQPASQRVDEDFIEKNCNGCDELSDVVAALEAACAEGNEACSGAVEKMVNEQRTNAQVRNDQNLVGYPTANELLDAIQKLDGGSDGVAPSAGGEGAPEVPDKSLIAVVAIVGQLPADVTEVGWADLTEPAAAAGVDGELDEVEQYLREIIQTGEIPESCDAECQQVIKAIFQNRAQARNAVSEALSDVAAGK